MGTLNLQGTVKLNLEYMMQSEKFCYIQKVNDEA